MESRTAQIPMKTARVPVRVPTVLQSVLFFRLFLLRIRFFERGARAKPNGLKRKIDDPKILRKNKSAKEIATRMTSMIKVEDNITYTVYKNYIP